MPNYQVPLDRNTDLPALGVYIFKIMRGSEHDGTTDPYWRFFCQIQDKCPDQGKDVMVQLSLGESSRWKLNSFLDALGAPKKGTTTYEAFVGKLFRGKVEHGDDNNGVLRATISKFFPYEGTTSGPELTPTQPTEKFKMPEELASMGSTDEEDDGSSPFA